jgi:hypothetical protein
MQHTERRFMTQFPKPNPFMVLLTPQRQQETRDDNAIDMSSFWCKSIHIMTKMQVMHDFRTGKYDTIEGIRLNYLRMSPLWQPHSRYGMGSVEERLSRIQKFLSTQDKSNKDFFDYNTLYDLFTKPVFDQAMLDEMYNDLD